MPSCRFNQLKEMAFHRTAHFQLEREKKRAEWDCVSVDKLAVAAISGIGYFPRRGNGVIESS
jgi:hypothetical protein